MRSASSIIIYTGLVLFMLSCNKSPRDNSKAPPVPVSIFTVEPQMVSFYDIYPGTVTALKEVGLRGQVTGYVTGIFFTEGSRVAQGQKLYEIDRRQYEAAFREASDNVRIAQQNLAKDQLDVERYSKLRDQEAIARQRYDYAVTDLENAKLQVSVANQELLKAKTNLDFSLISAPFSGTIGLSQVRIGDLVTPGQTLMNTLSSDDPMGFDFVIDQSQLPAFQELQARKPDLQDSTFRLVMPDNSVYPLNGKIDLIDRAVDPQTGTITVRLIFPNPQFALRPGMNCNVRVTHRSNIARVVIPFKAVLEQMGEYFVFRTENDKAREIKVTLGPRVDARVVILGGLQKGDVIAVDGIEKLVDGTSVSTGPSQESHGKYGKF